MTLPRGRGPADARIMFIGEAYGKNEEQQGKPFVGAAGNTLNELCLQSGIDPSRCYYTNVVNQRPPDNDLSQWVTKGMPNDLMFEGMESLQAEINDVNPNVIVPLGNWALWALYPTKWNSKENRPMRILDYRGYLMEAKKLVPGKKIIPTVHPSFIMQGGYKYRGLCKLDLMRARAESSHPRIERTLRNVQVDPRGFDRELVFQRLMTEGRWISVDIEYLGSKLLCVGFSTNANWACTIVIRSPSDVEFCKRVIESGRPLLAQNAMFDFGILDWHYGIDGFKYLVYDTMVAAYNLNIEFPKDLGFLGALYTDLPPWWDAIDWDAIKKGKQSIETVWEYNCIDACSTYEIAEKQLVELQTDPKMVEAFEFDMRKILPLWNMAKRGVKIDTAQVKRVSQEAKDDMMLTQAALNQLAELMGYNLKGMDFNTKSTPQKADLLYKLLGAPVIAYTESGKSPASDVITLMELRRRNLSPAINTATELIVKNVKARGLEEKFVDIDWDDDGRARCIYDGTKTVTRRLSSKTFFPTGRGSNLQNIPAPGSSPYGEIVRECFVADPGMEFGYSDLKGAEFLVVAELTMDPLMLKYAQMSIDGTGDVHRETAAFVFGRIEGRKIDPSEIGKEDPRRFLGKKTRHSGNYMVGWKELMGRINAQAMDTGVYVTAAQMKLILEGYHALHPGLRSWYRDVELELREGGGVLRNLFGYPRRFTDRWSANLPEAVAFVPQSTVGDALNYGLLACDGDRCLRESGFKLLLNVHDAIGFQYPPSQRDVVIPRVRELMSVPLTFPKTKRTLRIPVEIAVGKSWGKTEVIK